VIGIETGVENRDGTTYAVLRITDSGSGIAPENLQRVFDPFFTTKPVGKGIGLGLYICGNIIAEHHGFIEIQSQVGAGTTFSILLPASEDTPC
jgi:signal transduction histidine kinase